MADLRMIGSKRTLTRRLGTKPTCTHVLQGLDVVCFATMKECWKFEINTFKEIHQRAVDKEDFCGVFGRAFLKAFTPELVKAAFAATGIHPFNRDVINAKQMKPSEATSTHAAFPLPQSSPVRAVLAAFHSHEFTHRDLYPDSSPCAGPSTFPGSLSSPTPAPHDVPIDPVLLSPTRKRHLDPTSDPDLFTPSKRMRFLGVGMASTASGSFLVTKAKATHLDIGKLAAPVFERIPDVVREPDWDVLHRFVALPTYTRDGLEARCERLEKELADARKLLGVHQAISEGQNAQLIVQDLTMGKLKQSLFEKEKGKKSDRIICSREAKVGI
ncbi:hypothetical protein K438DRAFT_2113177 [Mycena galopus ATCC 62051]|nr:hypothetical protein K438DRAFT_2113177 [Mycena galopus ATCC 62051]